MPADGLRIPPLLTRLLPSTGSLDCSILHSCRPFHSTRIGLLTSPLVPCKTSVAFMSASYCLGAHGVCPPGTYVVHYLTSLAGVLLAVAIQCVSVLWRNVRRGKGRHVYLLIYVILMTSLATAGVCMTAKWQQTYLIDQRNYPGGPMAYYTKFADNPLSTASRFW